jgi:hypothetical protein
MAAGAGGFPRGLPLRLMTGAAVASVATLLVVVIWLAEPDPVRPDPRPVDVVRVGVVEGQSVPGYLTSSHGELRTLAHAPGVRDTWALVTLRSYLAPDRLTPLLRGVAVAQVYARAPSAGAPTAVVRIAAYRIPDDVVAGMLAEAVSRDQERTGYRRLSEGLSGAGQNEIRLRRAYDTAAQAAGDEASAYRARCSCVFAAVVRATPAALSALAGRPGVRAVDPAPEVQRLDRAEFRPPLPEQWTATPAGPAGPRSVAPASPAPLPSSLGARVTSAPSAGPVVGSGPSVPASEEHSAVPRPTRGGTPAPSVSAPALSRRPGAATATSGPPGR